MGIETKVVITGSSEDERREAAKRFIGAQADFARAWGQFRLGNAFARRAAVETDPDFLDKDQIEELAQDMLSNMAREREENGDDPMMPELLVALFGTMAEIVAESICKTSPLLDDGDPIATC